MDIGVNTIAIAMPTYVGNNDVEWSSRKDVTGGFIGVVSVATSI